MKKIVFFILLTVLAPIFVSAGYSIDVQAVKYIPYPAEPGGKLDLWIEAKNSGNSISPEITLEIVPEYPFSFYGDQNAIKIAKIYPRDSVLLHYELRVADDAIGGWNELKLRHTSDVKDGIWSTKKFSIYILGKGNLEVSKVTPTTLFPGKATDLVFTLTNVGSSPISNLIFSWEEANNLILPLGSDNKKYVSSLDAGEEAEIAFKVVADPNILPGVYSVSITISYGDEDITTLESKIGFIVGGGTNFDVSLESSSSGQVSLSLANIGANNAAAVVVRIPNQDNFTVNGTDSMILGNLNKGDFTLATFQISSNFNANRNFVQLQREHSEERDFADRQGNPQERMDLISESNESERLLLVEIDYTDTTGERQTVRKFIPFTPAAIQPFDSEMFQRRSTTGFFGLGNLPIFGVVIVVIVAGFLFYRKRKKKVELK